MGRERRKGNIEQFKLGKGQVNMGIIEWTAILVGLGLIGRNLHQSSKVEDVGIGYIRKLLLETLLEEDYVNKVIKEVEKTGRYVEDYSIRLRSYRAYIIEYHEYQEEFSKYWDLLGIKVGFGGNIGYESGGYDISYTKMDLTDLQKRSREKRMEDLIKKDKEQVEHFSRIVGKFMSLGGIEEVEKFMVDDAYKTYEVCEEDCFIEIRNMKGLDKLKEFWGDKGVEVSVDEDKYIGKQVLAFRIK